MCVFAAEVDRIFVLEAALSKRPLRSERCVCVFMETGGGRG